MNPIEEAAHKEDEFEIKAGMARVPVFLRAVWSQTAPHRANCTFTIG
jgi:hypothetical protein